MRHRIVTALVLAASATTATSELALVEPVRGANCSWEVTGQRADGAKRLGAGWVTQTGSRGCDTIFYCSYAYLAAHQCATGELVFITTYFFDIDLEGWVKEDAPYSPDDFVSRLSAKALSSPERAYVPGYEDQPDSLEPEVKLTSGVNDGFLHQLANPTQFENWTWSQCACEKYYPGIDRADTQ